MALSSAASSNDWRDENPNLSLNTPMVSRQPWLPVAAVRPATPQTIAEPPRSHRFKVAPAIRTFALLALAAVVVMPNLDRLQRIWYRIAPPPDDVTLDQPIPQMLFIRSDPPGARVFLNDRAVGRTPFAQGYSDAGARMHVRIEAPGYVPWRSSVDLANDGARFDVHLKRRPRRALPALALAQAQ